MIKEKGMMNGIKGSLKNDFERQLKIQNVEEILPFHVAESREPVLNKQP